MVLSSFKQIIYPKYTYIANTMHVYETVLERIEESNLFSYFQDHKYIVLRRRRSYRNMSAPVICIALVDSCGGSTTFDIEFRQSVFFTLCYTLMISFCMVFLSFVCIFNFIRGHTIPVLGVLSPILFFLYIVSLNQICYWYEVYRAKRILDATLCS